MMQRALPGWRWFGRLWVLTVVAVMYLVVAALVLANHRPGSGLRVVAAVVLLGVMYSYSRARPSGGRDAVYAAFFPAVPYGVVTLFGASHSLAEIVVLASIPISLVLAWDEDRKFRAETPADSPFGSSG